MEAVLALVFGRRVHRRELLELVGRVPVQVVVAGAEQQRERSRIVGVAREVEGQVAREATRLLKRARPCGRVLRRSTVGVGATWARGPA